MSFDSHLLAQLQNGTSGAVWEIAGANVFSKGDQESIDLDPIAAREFLTQRDHCLFRRGGLHITPAIRHAMDMNVDADKRFSAGNPQNKMGTLGTNP